MFRSKGILHYHSCVRTPEQNSVVERKHQHILNVARALLFQSSVPLCYWGDCVLTAVYLINCMPSPLLSNKTPFELLNHKEPLYAHLRTFGCLCYGTVLSHHKSKFSPRARASVFLGYPLGYKGYKLLDLESNQIHISRHVVFHESIFPFAHAPPCSLVIDFFTDRVLPTASSSLPLPSQITDTNNTITSPTPRQSSRIRSTPSYLTDYHCALTVSPLHSPPSTFHLISDFLSYNRLLSSHRRFALAITSQTDPTLFTQAILSPEWRHAMNAELHALTNNHT